MEIYQIARMLKQTMYHHPKIINDLVNSLLTRVRKPDHYAVKMVLHACAHVRNINKLFLTNNKENQTYII